ncbi:hypothetical protein RJ639_022498 [Escallonia herrerae]|uniref:Uncharacterized protein n=1 Tax=Escallonia herrerae TaxID=1293975 RepID=A0AA88V5X3_9ASTE|nr:hypothetical protein RJ639_022498 [Escallonia herrerae]
MELGYTGLAYTRTIKGIMSKFDRCSTPLFHLSSLLRLSPSLSSTMTFHHRLLAPSSLPPSPVQMPHGPAQASALNLGNSILKSYDIGAGQRSISSTFLFRSSNRSSDCKDVQIKAPIRMLACPSPNSSTVGCTKALSYPNQFRCIPFFPGKERPFLSPVTTGDMKGAIKGEDCDKKSGEAEVNCVLDAAFEQLKHSNTEKEDSCIESVVGTSCTYEMRYARKRSNPFEEGSGHLLGSCSQYASNTSSKRRRDDENRVDYGAEPLILQQLQSPTSKNENLSKLIGSAPTCETDIALRLWWIGFLTLKRELQGVEKQSAQKRLLVLGGDRNSKHEGKIRSFMSNEKPKPLFNHYANGSGWWDCNMEGVDNDEVGFCKNNYSEIEAWLLTFDFTGVLLLASKEYIRSRGQEAIPVV